MEEKKNDIGPTDVLNVVDTSAFITYPRLISHIEGQVFVPLTVIKQLDGLKNNSNINLSKRARQASFSIERAIAEKKVGILIQYDRIDALDSESDNRIVGAAVRLKNSNPDARVVLIATDRNMRIAADGYGIVGRNVIVTSVKTREDVLAEYKKRLKHLFWFMMVLLGVGFFAHGLMFIEDAALRYLELFLAACILIPTCVAAHKFNKRHPAPFCEDYSGGDDGFLKNLALGRGDPKDWIYFDF